MKLFRRLLPISFAYGVNVVVVVIVAAAVAVAAAAVVITENVIRSGNNAISLSLCERMWRSDK